MKNVNEAVEEIIRGNNYLSKYDWDAVMVIALAAFAANYGVFRIFVESSANNNNQVFKNIALLKQLPGVPSITRLVGEIDNIMRIVVEMIEFALKLMKDRREYNVKISTNSGSVDYVAHAACYTVRTIVTCASLITAPANEYVNAYITILQVVSEKDFFKVKCITDSLNLFHFA